MRATRALWTDLVSAVVSLTMIGLAFWLSW